MDYYSSIWAPTDSLMHYGVIGMKWGVRRYQEKNGKLTALGRIRLRAEMRRDNRKAFQLGKDATIAEKTVQKAEKGFQNTKIKNMKSAQQILEKTKAFRDEKVEKAENHRSQMAKKYGDDVVTDIKRDANGHVNEKTINWKHAIGAATAIGLLGTPLNFLAAGYAPMLLTGTELIPLVGETAAAAILATPMANAVGSLVAQTTDGNRQANRAYKNIKKSSKEA